MKLLVRLLRAAFFLVLFALALKNEGMVTLHFFLGTEWQAPLALILAGTLLLGLAIGMSVNGLTLLRQQRELLLLRSEIRALCAAPEPEELPKPHVMRMTPSRAHSSPAADTVDAV